MAKGKDICIIRKTDRDLGFIVPKIIVKGKNKKNKKNWRKWRALGYPGMDIECFGILAIKG